MTASFEDQLATLERMLKSVGEAPVWGSESKMLKSVPCSFGGLDAWMKSIPSREAAELAEQIGGEVNFLHSMMGLDPGVLEGLSEIGADDPRGPELLSRLQAAWPERDRLERICRLYECACTTMSEVIKQRADLGASPLGATLDDAVQGSGKDAEGLRTDLDQVQALMNVIRSFVPGDGEWPPPTPGLTMVEVVAPDINRLFSASGKLETTDDVSSFLLPDASGKAFFQSRWSLKGEPGTPAEGLAAYMYRIDLTGMVAKAGIAQVIMPIARPATVKFDDAGGSGAGELFVIIKGGIGSRAPARAEFIGKELSLTFNPPLRSGDSKNSGESSFFFGFAAAGGPATATVLLRPDDGKEVVVSGVLPSV